MTDRNRDKKDFSSSVLGKLWEAVLILGSGLSVVLLCLIWAARVMLAVIAPFAVLLAIYLGIYFLFTGHLPHPG